MLRTLVLILLSTVLIVISENTLSDVVHVFNFTKADGANGEFNFEQKVGNEIIFRGRTLVLSEDENHVFVMQGANGSYFWVELNDDELQRKTHFMKYVRRVQIYNESSLLAHFKDDYRHFSIHPEGSVSHEYYDTEWNTDSVCFKLIDKGCDKIQYVILSKNNSRRKTGILQIEKAHEYVMIDDFLYDGMFKVSFTEEELNSTAVFCKSLIRVPVTPLDEHIGGSIDEIYGGPTYSINPNLLKALVG